MCFLKKIIEFGRRGELHAKKADHVAQMALGYGSCYAPGAAADHGRRFSGPYVIGAPPQTPAGEMISPAPLKI